MSEKTLVIADKTSDLKKLAGMAKALAKNGAIIAADGTADELMYYIVEEGAAVLSQSEKNSLKAEQKGEYLVAVVDGGHPLMRKNPCGVLRIVRAGTLKQANELARSLTQYDLIVPAQLYENNMAEETLPDRRKEMDISSKEIEDIVRSVLNGMGSNPSHAPKSSGEIPQTAHVAMLTSLEHFEVKEFPMPQVGDDDILVKVEGCGVCGTDAHEFKRDPFGLIPVALGHEGTGEIVKMGKNVKKDSAGKPLNIGDKVVTCMIFKDNPDITMFDLNKQNVGGADVYGLLPDDDVHLNGWFSDYILVRGGSTIFNVSDLDLDSRILIEPCAVLIHAVERAKTTGILRFNSRVAVQGCGPIGLICIAVLRTMGIENIVAVDGDENRLAFAKKMGAGKTVNFTKYDGSEALSEGVKEAFGGYMADFAFQCTGSPVAHSNIYKFIRNGGGLCELGFFINGGDATINPHFDICSKEITTVGSWVYTLRDYATTFDFLKRAKEIGLPMKDLITHKFPLNQINEALKTNLNREGIKIAIVNE